MISAACDKQVRSSFAQLEIFTDIIAQMLALYTLSRAAFPISGLLDYHEFLSTKRKDDVL